MAKQRLVDFRGGLNDLISPHMIGDSQGQDALNVDLSAVRLQGRLEIDPSSTADGSFFYEYGNVSEASVDGRWVSIYPEDTNTYLAGATDFAVWNKDLYVAYGENSTDGKLRVYRDSADVAEVLDFNPPSSLSIATYNATVTSEFLAPTETLINSVAGIDYVAPISGAHPVTDTSQVDTSDAVKNYYYTAFTTNVYTPVGPNATHGNRQEYTQTVNGVTTSYYENSTTKRLQRNTGGSAAYTLTLSPSTASQFDPPFNGSGSFSDSRSFSGVDPQTFNVYTRTVSGTTTTYYNPTANNSNLGVTTANFYTQGGGSSSQTVSLSLSTVNQFIPVYESAGTFNDYSTRPSSGIANFTFNLYTRNGTTYYYAPSSNSTLGVSGGSFYTQDAGSGTSSQTINLSLSTFSDSGFNPAYSNLNATFNDRTLRPYTGVEDYTFSHTFSRNGITYYYASTANSTLGVQANNFYRISSTGTNTTTNVWSSELLMAPTSLIGSNPTYGNWSLDTFFWVVYLASNSKYSVAAWANPPNNNYAQNAIITNTDANGNLIYYNTKSAALSPYATFTGLDGNFWKVGTERYTYTNSSGDIFYIYSLFYRTGTTTSGTNNTYELHTNSYNQSTNVNYTYSIHTNSTTISVPSNYTYSIHTNSTTISVPSNYTYSLISPTPYTQSFPSTLTYADHTDTVPGVTGKPETPAFTYDKARSKIYLEYNSSSDVNAEDTDNAQGAQWLINRDFSLTDNGYYLKTVRESNNLPQVSSSGLKATLASNNSYVLEASLEHTPQRLNFTIGTPTDNATAGTTLKGYKLERRDSIGTVDLGYISPDTGVSFDYTPSTKAVTITLPTSTTAKYRLKFSGYQNTHVQINSLPAVKSNMSGYSFTGSSNKPTITLIPQDGASQQFLAADFWLERVIIDGATSADDIYATVRCFDVFDRNGNAISSGTIEGTSDFLDVFPNGLSSGAISDSGAEEGVPTHLKFLRESNNFFFAVGTESTPNNRYASTNKADSYLFISEYNNPRSWPLSGYLEFDSTITGLASYPGELIAFTEGGVYRVTGSRYDQMRKTKLATTEGLRDKQHRSIALVNRYLCWVSQTGICIYNGESVTNITRGRIENFNLTGSSVHAGQFEDVYYVVDSSETGYSVDFSLEGFPVSRIDLKEPTTTTPINSANPAQVLPPVLVYRPSVNRLYSRRGIIEGVSTRNLWSYKTRAFDGGAFGSIKLVRNVTVNGTGSGKIQIYLDGKPVFKNSSNVATPKTISVTDSTTSTRTEPARVYVPATSDTIYGLSVADVWSVEITDWNGRIDWIDTEYEILSGG